MNEHVVASTTRGRRRRGSPAALAVIILVLSLLAAACGGGADQDATQPDDDGAGTPATDEDTSTDTATDDGGAAADEPPLRVALITPGPVSDQGYNFAAALGMQMAEEEFGIETAISENVPIAENAQVIRGYAADGFDVIIGHGEHNGQPMLQVAEEFPDVRYFVHAGDVEGHPSIMSAQPRQEDAGYLQGIVAGHLSENGHMGFVAFTPLAAIVRVMNASRLGAETVQPDMEFSHVFTDNLVDPSVTREATNALIGNGADVILHINGGPNSPAIIEAAAEAGVYAMGFPVDQSEVAPDTVATSQLVNYPRLILLEIESVLNDEFQGGQIVEFSLESGVVGIAELADWIPEEARQAVEEARQQIMSGELRIDVPSSLPED